MYFSKTEVQQNITNNVPATEYVLQTREILQEWKQWLLTIVCCTVYFSYQNNEQNIQLPLDCC